MLRLTTETRSQILWMTQNYAQELHICYIVSQKIQMRPKQSDTTRSWDTFLKESVLVSSQKIVLRTKQLLSLTIDYRKPC